MHSIVTLSIFLVCYCNTHTHTHTHTQYIYIYIYLSLSLSLSLSIYLSIYLLIFISLYLYSSLRGDLFGALVAFPFEVASARAMLSTHESVSLKLCVLCVRVYSFIMHTYGCAEIIYLSVCICVCVCTRARTQRHTHSLCRYIIFEVS